MIKKLTNNTAYFFIAVLPLLFMSIPTPKLPGPGIDVRLKPQVEKFEKWGKYMRGKDYKIPEISISIGPMNDFNIGLMSPNAIGVCYYFTNLRAILISEKFWNDASPTKREMVVFHELGHCALNRGHNDSLSPWGEQISLMYPSLFNERQYLQNYRYYIDELFNPY